MEILAMKFAATITLASILAACGPAEAPSQAPDATADAQTIAAEWRLSQDQSRLAFVSIKAGDLAEVHSFADISGTVDPSGAARLEIGLDSVETGIDIRNQRMRDLLFETETHPTAHITADLSPGDFQDLNADVRLQRSTEIAVDLHGVRADFEADLLVTRLGEDRVLVETASPLLLHAGDFDLSAGVEQLTEVAGLPGISPAVPVTVSLVFER
jgi:hypothetical protein